MDHVLIQLSLLMAKLSLLSFGSVAVIVAELQREAVERGWMTQAEFAEAYALGAVVPGPATLWVVPVGYQAAGPLGGLVALLAFFAPPALAAMLFAALWDRLRTARWPKAARTAITPVAVGLIAASAYSLTRATVQDLPGLALLAAAAVVLLATKLPTPLVVATAGLIGSLFLAH
jgi:chromate transporter